MSEALALDDPPVTIATYDAFLESHADPRAWELVAGRIIGMTNPTQRHAQIVANIGTRLKATGDRRGCHTFFGDVHLQRSGNMASIDKPRPDLMVRCGEIQEQNYATDPLVVVEVLSPSTMDVDRGEKLRFYRRIPTLVHVVLVYQDQMRAEHYRRIDTGWQTEVVTQPDDTLRFEALSCHLSLADAYAGVPLGTRIIE